MQNEIKPEKIRLRQFTSASHLGAAPEPDSTLQSQINREEEAARTERLKERPGRHQGLLILDGGGFVWWKVIS